MRQVARTLFVAALFAQLTIVACANNKPPAATANLSQTGLAAYQATRVVKALDVLRDVVVEGEKQTPKVFSAGTTLKVIAYHREVVQTIDAVPGGWRPVAVAGLDGLLKELSPSEQAQVAPFVALLRALYQEGVL